MDSPLSFNSTEGFRRALLIRNLPPYEDFKTEEKPGESELTINDVGVADPGNVEDIGNERETFLYTKNKYGPENSRQYGDTVDINISNQTETNKGEYDYYSSEPTRSNEESLKRLYLLNWYGPAEGFGDLGPVNIDYVNNLIEKRDLYYRFIASTYNAFNILTFDDPEGNNGLLSQDSELARIAANQLRTEFQFRISEESYQQTLGRINVLDALSDPFDALAIATGREQVVESNWRISVPDNIVGKGLDFISRITGVYSPYSWIPGDYFGEDQRKSFLNQIVNSAFKNRKENKFPENRNASDVFLANTGQGQSNRLFKTLELNRFRPDYRANFINDLNLRAPDGEYYVGSRTSEINTISSPITERPINEFGESVQAPVRGYSGIAQEYENSKGNQNEGGKNDFRFGISSSSYYNDSNALMGGLVWASSKREYDAGTIAAVGGESYSSDRYSYNPNMFDKSKSNAFDFREGSILDETQKLVDAASELGGSRLYHVGNAISQISKVFHDGNREITKGSSVYNLEDEFGDTATEYCRVFSKDTPYVVNDDLQKSTGMETENRAFSYSVLTNTYNLNIAPWKGQGSSNIQNKEVKKYMFSIENLSWRTSNKKGFTYQDLPHCERGPNRGRIMWFPPYDLKVSEQNSVNWNTNEFIGRPEPIYTYSNTQRQGNLSWKIVVDHPSVLNAIVDKEMKGKDKERVNQVVDAFFAGCKTYDVYELAEKYPQFKPSDIYDIIKTIEDEKEVEEYMAEIPRYRTYTTEPVLEEYTNVLTEDDWNFAFYFHHDEPGPSNDQTFEATQSYETVLGNYLNISSSYTSGDHFTDEQIQQHTNFFESDVQNTLSRSENLGKKIGEVVKNGGRLKIKLVASASSPQSVIYNSALSRRRMDSVVKYIMSLKIDNDSNRTVESIQDKIDFDYTYGGEEVTVFTDSGQEIDCSEPLNGNDAVFSINAMACRRVKIADVEEIGHEPRIPEDFVPEEITEQIESDYELREKTTITKKEKTNLKRKEEVAKIIVRKLLSECDYFEMMKEDSPMIYDGIKEKFKYFHPAFHSTTPEGLNSRLTFLQQCLRPGDTIPTIDENGKPRENDALNTSFGAPPICVLRIGDFYHTKIAINQISINYEPLTFDLNPEGIGVQPMIADVNMSFYFIGGQGLKEPVARLQNALSFNYYANTEVYDERAEVTEDRTKLNEKIWKRIEENTDMGINSPSDEGNQNAGDTIGVIQQTTIVDESFSGTTSYNKVVNDLVGSISNYIDTSNKTLKNIINTNSEIGLYYYLLTTKYNYGQIYNFFDQPNSETIKLLGKPTEIQDRAETLFYDLIYDIEAGTSPIIANTENFDLRNRHVKKFKKNLLNLCLSYRDKFTNELTQHISQLSASQTNMIEFIDKINFVTSDSDGYRNPRGKVIIYDITGTTEIHSTTQNASDTKEELLNDLLQIAYDIDDYNLRINNDVDSSQDSLLDSYKMNGGSLYSGFLTGNYDTEEYTKFVTMFYSSLITDPESLKKEFLGEDLINEPEWELYLNQQFYGSFSTPAGLNYILGDPHPGGLQFSSGGIVGECVKLKNKSNNKYKKFIESNQVTKFTDYEPFNKEKERIFNYTQQSNSLENQVRNFELTYSDVNAGSPSTFNYKQSFN